MTQIEILMNSVHEAREKLLEAEGAMKSFLEPTLNALGIIRGGTSHYSINNESLDITRTGSSRGYRWDNDYTFPLAIFTCEDPLKAAAEYVAAKKKAKEDEEHNRKHAELRRLQEELHGSSL